MSERKRPKNGKPASPPIGRPLKNEQPHPGPDLERLLRAVYDRYQKLDDPAANAEARRDFVFHMTDWSHNLEELAVLYANPEKFDKAAAGQAVFSFLIHAIPHLKAAG